MALTSYWERLRSVLGFEIPNADRYVSLQGNDAVSDGTASNPDRTIQKAVAHTTHDVNETRTIYVGTGEYNGTVINQEENDPNERDKSSRTIIGLGQVVFRSLLRGEFFVKDNTSQYGDGWLGDKNIELRDYDFPYKVGVDHGLKAPVLEQHRMFHHLSGAKPFSDFRIRAAPIDLKKCLWVNQHVSARLGNWAFSTFDGCVLQLCETSRQLDGVRTLHDCDAQNTIFLHHGLNYPMYHRNNVYDPSCRFGWYEPDVFGVNFVTNGLDRLIDGQEYIVMINTVQINFGLPNFEEINPFETFVYDPQNGNTYRGSVTLVPVYPITEAMTLAKFSGFDWSNCQVVDPQYISPEQENYAKHANSPALTASFEGGAVGYLGEGVGFQAVETVTTSPTGFQLENLRFETASQGYVHVNAKLPARITTGTFDMGRIVLGDMLLSLAEIAYRKGQAIDIQSDLSTTNMVVSGSQSNTASFQITEAGTYFVKGYTRINLTNADVTTAKDGDVFHVTTTPATVTGFEDSGDTNIELAIQEVIEMPNLQVMEVQYSAETQAADFSFDTETWHPFIIGMPMTVDANGNANGAANFDSSTARPVEFRYIRLRQTSTATDTNVRPSIFA
ncbi:MAG: hypothetical protein ACPGJS_05525 [Flammeovirgaceae bacterium]